MRKFKRGTVLEVAWEDACGTAEWVEYDEPMPPPRVKTVGYFVRWDHGGILLAVGYAEKGSGLCGVSFIPRGMIRKIRRLK